MIFRDVREDPFTVYGLYHYRQEPVFRRLPQSVAMQANEGVQTLHTNTAGGRVKFKTNSKTITIQCDMPSLCDMPHMPRCGSSGFDLYVKKGARYWHTGTFMPNDFDHGYTASYSFPCQQERDLLLHFPLYNDVTSLHIGLDDGATLSPGQPYRFPLPVVYYGSSITQGGCASRPGNSYPAVISRKYDCDFLNLGFAGSAKGEPALAEYIAQLPMSAFVLDYDHNAPDVEHLQSTHEAFYQRIRRQQPTLPILLVGRPDFYMHKQDDSQRRDVILTTYRNALQNGDSNVYFLDGHSLFEGDERDACTVDGKHPNDLGFHRMASVIGSVIGTLL